MKKQDLYFFACAVQHLRPEYAIWFYEKQYHSISIFTIMSECRNASATEHRHRVRNEDKESDVIPQYSIALNKRIEKHKSRYTA